jgi:hypothetical protein
LRLCYEWYCCCKTNLERYENGSREHKRWLQHSLNAIIRIIEIEEMLEDSIKKEEEKAARKAA